MRDLSMVNVDSISIAEALLCAVFRFIKEFTSQTPVTPRFSNATPATANNLPAVELNFLAAKTPNIVPATTEMMRSVVPTFNLLEPVAGGNALLAYPAFDELDMSVSIMLYLLMKNRMITPCYASCKK
ncbi:MAG TPA: hypothetical protein VD884_03800 [Ohtaekwangia sp.]|nr:hypothetical protein [Ohtaekwangia sp.]